MASRESLETGRFSRESRVTAHAHGLHVHVARDRSIYVSIYSSAPPSSLLGPCQDDVVVVIAVEG